MDRVALFLGGGTFVAGGVTGGLLAWYWEKWALDNLKSRNRRTMFAVTTGVLSGLGAVYLITRVGSLKVS